MTKETVTKPLDPNRCEAIALIDGKTKQCVKRPGHTGRHSVWIKSRQHYTWSADEQH